MAMYRSTLVPYYTKFQSYNYGEYADYMSCFVAEADKRGAGTVGKSGRGCGTGELTRADGGGRG